MKIVTKAAIISLVFVMSFGAECTTSGVENTSTTDKGLEATSRTQDLNKKPEIVKNATNTENNATNAEPVVSKQKPKKFKKQVRGKSGTPASKKESSQDFWDWKSIEENAIRAIKDSNIIVNKYGLTNKIR